MVVTVDLDLEEMSRTERILYLARIYSACSRLDCRIYRTSKGLHVYIMLEIDPRSEIVLRRYLGDDSYRLEVDIERLRVGAIGNYNTLFKSKYEDGKIKYVENSIDLSELLLL